MKPYLLQHLLEISTARSPDKIAIQHKESRISYADLQQKTLALGSALQQFSSEAGERVAILVEKSIEQVISLLGVLYSEKVFVIINPSLQQKQIKHILNDCNVKMIISSAKFEGSLNEILSETEVTRIIRVAEMNDLITANYGQKPKNKAQNTDISNIIYTSGSTGLPKGIVLTHQNLIEGAEIVSEYLEITANERILGLLPFNFDYGLNQLTTTLLNGATIILFQYFMPNTLLKTLVEEQITGLAAIPPIWASVFNNNLSDIEKNSYDFSNLRYITNSGGKIPVAIVKKIRRYFSSTDLYLMYGLTEAFRSTYLDPAEVDKRPDSMGKAIPRVQVAVINDKGQVCQPNEEGELIHSGACISQGYWNNPDKTSEVFRKNPLNPGETAVFSGDIVKKDSEGFLYFIGRKDNMIKTAGYRVSPTEVEEIILQHPDINDAVVFGLEDNELGQKIRALVITSSDITAEEIINYCKKESPSYLVPKEVFVLDSFPTTASGKIDRTLIKNNSVVQHGN